MRFFLFKLCNADNPFTDLIVIFEASQYVCFVLKSLEIWTYFLKTPKLQGHKE